MIRWLAVVILALAGGGLLLLPGFQYSDYHWLTNPYTFLATLLLCTAAFTVWPGWKDKD